VGPPSIPLPAAHGGDGAAIAAALGLRPDEIIDLSLSLNPFAPDVTAIVATKLSAVRRYPDPSHATAALAAAIGVPAERVVLTNGAAEAIALVAAATGGGRVEEPDFSLYPRDRAADLTAPCWRSNPNNPLGTLAAPADRAAVWDEAFWQLATGTWTRGDDGTWRIGSLTKVWACPGLRIGYVIAPDADCAAQLAAAQPRWSVNALAVAVVPALLELTDLAAWACDVRVLRAEFVASLRECGISVIDTAANWVLVERLPDARARLARHAVVVRDCATFGLPDLVRVALPRPDQLADVVAAFARL